MLSILFAKLLISLSGSYSLVHIDILKHLTTAIQPEEVEIVADVHLACSDYLVGVWWINNDEKNHNENQGIIDTLAQCWSQERADLLTFWQADHLYIQGQHEQLCERLQKVGASDKLLEVAQNAAAVGNWHAVESYLLCAKGFDRKAAWISPNILAQLYFKLGNHYEAVNDVDRALQAYRNSTASYSVVWHAPYEAGAKLYDRQEKQNEAINWLTEATNRTEDPTALFYLWQEIGWLWLKLDEEQEAICAMTKALDVVNDVPPQNITTLAKVQFEEQYAKMLLENRDSLTLCK